MDINWEFQQENARLQSQIKRMSAVIIGHGIPEDDDYNERVLTRSQADFVRALELNYSKVYRLAKKHRSGFDAIEEILEADGYEFKRVI